MSRWEIRGVLIDLLKGHSIEVVDSVVTEAADRLCSAIEDYVDERLHQGMYASE
jgi:predicted ATPase